MEGKEHPETIYFLNLALINSKPISWIPNKNSDYISHLKFFLMKKSLKYCFTVRKKIQGAKILQGSTPQQNTENDKLQNNFNFYLDKIYANEAQLPGISLAHSLLFHGKDKHADFRDFMMKLRIFRESIYFSSPSLIKTLKNYRWFLIN